MVFGKIGLNENQFSCYACILDRDVHDEYNGSGTIISTFDNVQYNGNRTENVQYVNTFEDLKNTL